MRVLSIGLWVMAGLALVAWVLFYIWAMGMACAFVTGGNCRIRWPWELGGEDLRFLVLAPGSLFASLAAAAWSFGRGRPLAGAMAGVAGLAVLAWVVVTLG
jgi:hypothetical protein